MSQDTATANLSELEQVVETYGWTNLAQRVIDRLPSLSLSAQARKDLNKSLKMIQLSSLECHRASEEMVAYGSGFIEAKKTRIVLRDLLLEAATTRPE